MNNMFTFIAAQDWKVLSLWNQIVDIAGLKLKQVEEYLRENSAEIVRGIEMTTDSLLSAYDIFVVSDDARAIKSKDAWVVRSTSKKTITVENRFTRVVLDIPLKSTRFGLRRLSRVDTMNITNKLDYLVVKDFDESNLFFSQKDKISNSLSWWRKYIESRSTDLVFSRRFDLSAPGTRLLVYFSSKPLTPTKLFWCIKGLSEENRKLLTLWFNSTFNLLQVFLERMETRGAFMNYDKYVLESSLLIDTETLSSQSRKFLIDTFDEIKDEKFPSLLEQLRNKYPTRIKIDKAILKALGFDEEKAREILDYLYPALAREIEKLKTLMEG